MFDNFLRQHPPGPDVRPVAEAKLTTYQDLVSPVVLDFWRRVGRGSFSQGLLHFFDPAAWQPTLDQWLGGPQPGRVPIARSAFGDIFYYRRKQVSTEYGVAEVVEDTNLVDVHYKRIDNCTWEVAAFFDDYLCDPGIVAGVLRQPLYEAARPRLGAATATEAYIFTPWLAMGGSENDPATLQKGEVQTALALLLQL